MSYINRAPKRELADILARNLTEYEFSNPEYKRMNLEELEKSKTKFYWSKYNRFIRENEETLRQRIKEERLKRFDQSKPSQEDLDKQRIETLVQSSQDSLQERLF